MGVKGGAIGLDVNGIEFDIDPDSAKHSLDDSELETILGARGAIGSSSKGAAPFIECKAYLDETQLESQLRVENVTITLRLRDRTVSLAGGTTIGRVEVEDKDRSATVRFEGRSGKSVLL